MSNNEINQIIKEAIEEGILDNIKSSLGFGSSTDEYQMLPKEVWISLIKNEPRRVNIIANSDINSIGSVILDVLKDISDTSPEARKVLKQLENAVRAKDKVTVVKIVRGIQKEADKIRAVRSGGVKLRESYSFKGLKLSNDISRKFEKNLDDKLSNI